MRAIHNTADRQIFDQMTIGLSRPNQSTPCQMEKGTGSNNENKNKSFTSIPDNIKSMPWTTGHLETATLSSNVHLTTAENPLTGHPLIDADAASDGDKGMPRRKTPTGSGLSAAEPPPIVAPISPKDHSSNKPEDANAGVVSSRAKTEEQSLRAKMLASLKHILSRSLDRVEVLEDELARERAHVAEIESMIDELESVEVRQ